MSQPRPAPGVRADCHNATRRDVLVATATLVVGFVAFDGAAGRAAATPESLAAAIAALTRGAPVKRGRVALAIAPLVENGNTVPVAVTVESPMTRDDYVKAIHILNERNPQANVVSAWLGPRAGRAAMATRMRLADSQRVVALAELSDGSFWMHDAEVIVTLGACLEEPI